MKNRYLKVFVDVVILLSILVIMDVLVGWVGKRYTQWLGKTPRQGDAALVNYNLNVAKPDVAIIGSSTAMCHYRPEIIHDSILAYCGKNYEVFNMSVSNQRLAYDYYGLKCLLDRTTPKLVFVDVWASYLSEKNPSYSFEAFRPYANTNRNIKEMLKKHGEYDYMYKSNMYCFNTELVKLFMSAFKKVGANGFFNNKVEMPVIKKFTDRDSAELLPLSVEEFDGIVALAKDKQFNLIVVLSPTLNASDTTSLSYNYMKNKCEENNIRFLDYSNDESYYQTHLFRDKTHLNYYGAEVFTRNLMKDLKAYIVANY